MAKNFKAIAERMLANGHNYLSEWLPQGKRRGREYIIGGTDGAPGESLSINLDTGIWKDFATGEAGGDLISLYAAIYKLKMVEVAKLFSNGKDEQAEDTYCAGPEHIEPMPAHPKYGKPSYVFEYYNADGKRIGYICRFDLMNGSKQFSPRTCWRRDNGTIYWRWKKWPIATPIYRLPELLANPDAKVLIVEGEKKAKHAQQMMPPDWVVVGWCGGSEAVKSTDWAPLRGRYCWAWPDADEPGLLAMLAIKKIILDLNIVDLPEDVAQGWDLGDAPLHFPVMEFLQDGKELQVKVSQPTVSFGQQQLVLSHYDPQNPSKPLATMQNVRDILGYYKITCRYNVISKRIETLVPGEVFSMENADEAALACIYSRLKEWKIPVDGHQQYLIRIADENQCNPVLDWVRSRPWDKVSRLPEFYDTIESPEHEAKNLLVRRWLISSMCMALYNGIDGAGCLVLQGAQNIGKTWWVKKLVPDELREKLVRTDASVNPHDKDSVSQIISYWIVELGEIGATFNRADLQSLKTFITRDHDTMRRPYGTGDKRYPRRTSLVASVDQHFFLYDPAGDRRFWTIPCTSIESYHNVDMQQLWAEVLHLIETRGENWRLEPDELAHVRRINKEHQQIEPIHEMLETKYVLYNVRCTEWYNATQIAEGLNLKNVSQRETRIIADYLRKGGVRFRRSGKESWQFNIERRRSSNVDTSYDF